MTQKKKAPKKTRDLERSRKEILDAAFWEVYSRGFQGASIDDIVKKTSMTKGGFYHQFPTKLDLGYALVEEVITPMIIERWIRPLAAYENPIDGILAQIKKLIGDRPVSELSLGCPLNNLVQEMSPVDKGFHKRLQKALQLWITEMAVELKRGQDNGYIKKEIDVNQAATFIVMAHEGFYATLKGLTDKKIYDALFASLKIYLDSIAAK